MTNQYSSSDIVFETVKSKDGALDPFTPIPPEIRFMVLNSLSRRDTANLRLASPAFVQLPQTYFRRLISIEMPWVWEVKSHQSKQLDWYKLWCRLFAADGNNDMDQKARKWRRGVWEATYRKYRSKHGNSNQEPTTDVSMADLRTIDKECDAMIEAAYESGELIRREGEYEEVRGLRNRRRIYNDIEEILRRIAALDVEPS